MKGIHLSIRYEKHREKLQHQLSELGYEVYVGQIEEYLDKNYLNIVDCYHLRKYIVYDIFPLLYAEVIDDHTFKLIQKKHFCIGVLHSRYEGMLLQVAIETAFENKRNLQSLRKENKKLQNKLQDRRIVDKAKYLLMKLALLSEQEAYEKMRTDAMRQQKTLREIADIILITEE